MAKLSEEVLLELKKPFGELFVKIEDIIPHLKGKKIISVGDISTINLIRAGIKPHLAVFDFKSQRKQLEPQLKEILITNYPKPTKYTNEPGTLSDQILADSKQLIAKGGGILIEGEEDICALAFIINANKDYLIVYGQPDEGLVLVKPNLKLKRKIEKFLSA